jgi:hypothetical protein
MKKTYLWIAFTMLVLGTPGALFTKYDIVHLAPSFSLVPILNEIEFAHIITIVLLIKSLAVKKVYKNIIHFPFVILVFFLIIQLIASLYFGINDVRSWFRILRLLLPLTLFISLPKLIDKSDFKKMIYLFMPMIYLVFVFTIFEYITGIKILSLVGASGTDLSTGLTLDSQLNIEYVNNRLLYCPFIVFFQYISVTYLYLKHEISLKRYLIQFITILILIFFSGSRGWILAFVIMFIMILRYWNVKTQARIIVFMLFTPLLLITFIPNLSYQFKRNISRFETTIKFIEGDSKDLLSDNRIENRIPKLLDNIGDNWIFGYGFSDKYMNNRDGHIAHLNMIFNIGIVGLLLFTFLWLLYLYKIMLRANSTKNNRIGLLNIGFIGLLTIHSFSRQIFGYLMDVDVGYFLALYLLLSNYIYETKGEL